MSIRMRHTRAHTKNRRSHHALSEPAVSNESKDGAHLRHRVSPVTGKYKGEQVLEVNKKEKKVEDNKEEEIKEVKKKKETKKEKKEDK
jgi:ribosomal protein L32